MPHVVDDNRRGGVEYELRLDPTRFLYPCRRWIGRTDNVALALGGALLDGPAVADADDAVARLDVFRFMRDHDDGRALLAAK